MDTSMTDWILKNWPAGAALAGISIIAYFWVKFIIPPLFALLKERREQIAKERVERTTVDGRNRKDELDAKVRIAEAQQASICGLANVVSELKQITVTQQTQAASLASVSADMKATMEMAEQMHARCHAAGGACRAL
jgi:F0F1-type ATP synthase membrane subunit b/b'